MSLLFPAFLFLLVLPVSTFAQTVDSLDTVILSTVDEIVATYGQPDRTDYLEHKDANVWTYFASSSVEERALSTVTDTTAYHESAKRSLMRLPFDIGSRGYSQIAFWNGRVAAISYVATDTTATSTYDRSLQYMVENSGTIARGAGAENSRITRRGDNVWVIDKFVTDNEQSSVIRIGDAGYVMCSQARPAEMRRVKRQFGIALK